MAKNVIHVTDGDFEAKVLKSEIPVLVDFFATWCGPCKMIAPIVEALANEYDGKASFAKVDVDVCPKTAASFGIRGVPTLMIFKGGKSVWEQVGAVPKEALTQKLQAHIG